MLLMASEIVGHVLTNVTRISCLYLLTGLLKCETRYQEFPDLLYSIHFMIHVGGVLSGLRLTEDTSVQV